MTQDEQIIESNQRILNLCTEIIRKLAADPEAHITDVICHMSNVCISRSTQMRERDRMLRNACDQYDRRGADALA